MILIGLTGSIGMGKSTTARLMADEMDIPFHDADAAVHKSLGPDGAAVKPVLDLFPEAIDYDEHNRVFVNRQALGREVFNDALKMKQLEDILHPLARASSRQFVEQCRKQGRDFAVLDIPLLFETGAEKRVDVTFCVSAPENIQRQRVLSRPGMTEDKFKRILAKQIPDAEKRERADYIIMTDKGLDDTRRQIHTILNDIKASVKTEQN